MRLSPGSEPVVEVTTADLKELDVFLRSMRAQGVWSALKGAAREFADAPLAGIEATIEQMLPGAQVISDSGGDPPWEPDPPADLAAEAAAINQHNAGVVERARDKGEVQNPSLPEWTVKQSTPKCKTCGAATTPGSGTGKNGYWEALFCASGNRDHTHFIKQ